MSYKLYFKALNIYIFGLNTLIFVGFENLLCSYKLSIFKYIFKSLNVFFVFHGPLAEKLYLSLFVVWSSSRYMVASNQISIFFNIYRHKRLILTQYHLLPSSTNLYCPSTTKYQPVPVPSYIIFKCQTFLCHLRWAQLYVYNMSGSFF